MKRAWRGWNDLCIFIQLVPLLFQNLIEARCPQGTYGVTLCINCPITCAPLPNRNLVRPCDKTTGECLEGCVTGFHGPTCNDTCSKNCPNNTCNQHNGHCTRKCNNDSSGDFCNDDQKLGKESRQEDSYSLGILPAIAISLSILVILLGFVIFIWRYRKYKSRKREQLANQVPEDQSTYKSHLLLMEDHSRLFLGVLIILVCLTLASSSCSKCLDGSCHSNGLCIKGCVVGYADKKCQHRCQSTCKSLRCYVEMNTGKTVCSEGCEDGYCGVQCKTPCPHGCLQCDRHTCNNCSLCRSLLYGEACQNSCFHKCLGFACDNTGRCQNECMDGYYGVNCTKTCNQRCGKCHMLTGTCIKCRLGFYGDSCERLCPSCLTSGEDIYRCHSGCVLCSVGGKDTVTLLSPESKLSLNQNSDAMYTFFGVCIGLLSFIILLMALAIFFVRLKFRRDLISFHSQRTQNLLIISRRGSMENETELKMHFRGYPE